MGVTAVTGSRKVKTISRKEKKRCTIISVLLAV